MRFIFLAATLVFLLLSGQASADVVWLENRDGRNNFEKGFDAMKQKLDENAAQTRSDLWSDAHLYADKQEITWNDSQSKIFVLIHVLAVGNYNSKNSCQALIAKEREVLFSDSVRNGMKEFFPGVTDEDLRYLVQLQGVIDTLAVKNGNTQEEITPNQPYDAAKATVTTSTKCRTSAPSDSVFFE